MAEEDGDAAVADKLSDLQVSGDGDLGELNLDKKKKKKKKAAVVDMEAVNGEDEGAEEDADAAAGLDLSLGKKKKKRKPKARTDEEFGALVEDTEAAPDGEKENDDDGLPGQPKLPWDGTDRDYTYQELLDRVFGILRENNPELTGEKRRTIMKPPQVAREGTKKTVFTNFLELCKAMNRQLEHVQAFLLAELGTSGNLDGQSRLVVKGRFLPKAFEGVLRRYVNEYVLCNSCKSPDTLLDRDSATRIMFLRCQQCGASRTVAPIKAGFVARTSRRIKT
ncbi:hypothetical protein COCSUDRAFT_22793 [Coccomyxa subellipsoidea C-169]|uniref:Eukaryotic translation initiation factor 2 subunit beta n=1 Tax=Coccomyxa subellipsoidea (strain C-169) TaxID=574566 RepID=I0Z4M9_COCSC|nr:hypothetical protein COCSUDRAFT_22793 [Coccomyxa subellipsoidea C-169]EIE25598.1 hypothetical protein COCSUDRAFT_22793 [Coccomyxa subellipsoidea C-169]|eukprot:XP_005650142.1 hypothetical protein COCSUDRAFT_22793 [Coccomyxa subellipsoidea C-169]